MGRHSCCYKQKLRKGLWSPEEDEKLLNYITKHGHGCWSSVPKLAVENCTEKQQPTADTSNEKVSILSNEVNLIEAAATLKPPAISSRSKINTSIDSSKDRNSSGSNMKNTPPTQEFFLDRFGTSHESSPASCRPSDLMGYFPFQKLDYKRAIGLSMNPNTTLCFNPNSSSSEMISHEFNSSMTPPPIHPSVSTPMFQTPIRVKPSVSLPSDHNPSVASCDVNGVQNWEASSFSNGSSSSIELQSNTNFYESSAFSWGLADCGKSGEEAHLRSLGNDTAEDIKWSEYLNTTFFLGSTIQNQTSQHVYSEVKPESYFIAEGSSASWIPNQHQQASQPADIYTKDLQRLAVAFGQSL
ncbi:hypothetical protein OIU78_021434 [Salix suchowensis]|nr:hypothetical protein OIU78_021434 [Salix suchowensis]